MKLSFKFNYNQVCSSVLEEKLNAHHIKFTLYEFGVVELLEKVPQAILSQFYNDINKYGIEVVNNPKEALVHRIKDVVFDLVFNEQAELTVKTSVYLSEKLNYNYSYLSNLFSEITFTSLENYIILQKIEYAKMLLSKQEFTLTEIAFKLNYSSVAHLSKQFKNTTGITPSAFQRILKKRKEAFIE